MYAWLSRLPESFENGVAQGTRHTWREDGTRLSETSMKEGRIEGVFIRWHENGTKVQQVEMQGGEPHGLSRAWYPSGHLKALVKLDHGRVLNQDFFADNQVDLP